MPSQKRKRETYATPSSNGADSTHETMASEAGPNAPPTVTAPFSIQYLSTVDSKPKRRRVSGTAKAEKDFAAGREEAGVGEAAKPVAFTVHPGSSWDSMRKYKNFIVNDKHFGIQDYVYVNNGYVPRNGEVEDEHQFWIARVLEVRASDEAHVYLRVYWMYWPEELPRGREYYHGKAELVASNHMEIIDAMTVSDKAEITSVREEDDAPTAIGLYWRQTFDFPTQKVSTLRQQCSCKKYHNPDQLLVHCVNPTCAIWLHEGCILDATKRRIWQRLSAEDDAGESSFPPDTIQVSQKPAAASGTTVPLTPASTRNLPDALSQPVNDRTRPAAALPPKKRGRAKKSAATDPPWTGKIDAKLDLQSRDSDGFVGREGGEGVADDAASDDDDDDDDNREFTGRVVVTDMRGVEPRVWKEDAECLICCSSLREEE